MLKVVAVGDVHIKTDNIQEIDVFISKLERVLKKENPDFVVLLGDVLHTHERVHVSALNKAYQLVKTISDICKVFVLVGNHDMISNTQFLTDNHWMNGMKFWDNVVIVDKVVKCDNFVFCPYVFPSRFVEALNTIGDEWKDVDCIFAHQEFKGCIFGPITSTEGDEWDESYPQVISGHIHDKQHLGNNIYYCGSSIQTNFGETGINTISVLTWENSKMYKLREINLELPRKKTVHVDIKELEELDRNDWKETDKIKLTVKGNYEEYKALKKTNLYKEITSKGVKITFKPTKENIRTGRLEDNIKLDIKSILSSLIQKEDNEHLHKIYQEIINT